MEESNTKRSESTESIVSAKDTTESAHLSPAHTTSPGPVEKPEKKREEVPIDRPVHEIVGGSSVRQYLNKHLTKHLLEGLRQVSKDKPEDPLRTLGEYLINRSEELKKN